MAFRYEINGQLVEFEREPTEADIDEAAEQLTSTSSVQKPQPQNMVGLPKRQQVETAIAQRPDSVARFKEELGTRWNPVEHPFKAYFQPATTLMKLAAIPFQRLEAGVANPALEAQAGNFNLMDLARSSIQGVSGQQSPELGDIVRTTGFGGKFNEPIAGLTGLVGSGALAGGATKVAQVAAPKIGQIAQGAGKVATAPVRFVKNVARRSAANYITDDIAPQAHAIYKQSVKKFTPQIQQFAKEELKIPETAIKTISKNSVDDVVATAEKYGNSTDQIYQKIEQGFVSKGTIADESYKKAVSSFNGQIDSTPFFRATQNTLRRKGYVDLQGNPTTRFKSGLDTIYDDLVTMYLDMKNPVTSSGKKIVGNLMTKEDFLLYRDKLSRLLRDRPSDTSVMGLRNALYQSAEKSGMRGIINARNLERQAFQAEENLYRKGLISERKLDKFQKFTEAEKRQLADIEKYTGVKFIDDLDKVTAAKELEKFNKYTLDNFVEELNKAADRKYTTHLYKQYKNLLGEKDAMEIFKEIVAHRRAKLGKKIAIGAALAIGGKKAVSNRLGSY